MGSKETEERVVKGIQVATSRVLIPLEVASWTLVCLAIGAAAAYGATIYPDDRVPLLLTAIMVLLPPPLLAVSYYARGRRAIQAQDWYTWLFVAALLIAGVVNVYFALNGFPDAWFAVGGSVLFAAFTLYARFVKRASWTHQTAPVQTAYFRRSISKDPKVNLRRIWMLTIPVLVVGVALGFLQGWNAAAILLTFLGGFGTVFAPIWAYFTVPPGFLDRTKAELQGHAIPGERFLGAVYGSSFPTRPGMKIEDVDNSLFVTNHRLLLITIPGLRMGPRVRDTSQFYKSSAYHFLKEKGDAYLVMEPQKVVESHEFNIGFPYDAIEKLQLTAGLGLKLAGVNVVSVQTEDGTYRLLVHHPDEFEKLRGLLQQAAPDKIR